jgi:FixJ family two-component response regulator
LRPVIVVDPLLSKPVPRKGERNSRLTEREPKILQHIVAGESNKEIAAALTRAQIPSLSIVPTSWIVLEFTTPLHRLRRPERTGVASLKD